MSFNAPFRPWCKHIKRFRYMAPMRSAISSVIEDVGNDKRWDDELTASFSRLNFAAKQYISIGYKGAEDKSSMYSGAVSHILCSCFK